MVDPILQRYTGRQSVSTVDSENDSDNADHLGCWSLLRGVRDRAVALELRKKDDSVLAVPYAIIEQILYSPADGITLRVAGREIRIKGRQLNNPIDKSITLFIALTRHRVLWIAEQSRSNMVGDAHSTVVDSVSW